MRITRSLAWIYLMLLSGFALAQGPGKTVADGLGYPANARLLVIHADDFGVAHSQNRATMEALEHRWVTSASILAPCPWFPEVVAWAKRHPEADLGVHLTLNSEWKPCRWRSISPQPKNSSLFDADGFLPLTSQEVVQRAKPADVETEARAQIDEGIAAGQKAWGSEWRQNDFDLVRGREFQTFLKEQGFILVGWKDLAKSAP